MIDGIAYYVAGSSGGDIGPSESVGLGYFYQFLWCTVKEGQLHVAVIKSGNMYDDGFVSFEDFKISRAVWRDKLVRTSGKYSKAKSIPLKVSVENRANLAINNEMHFRCQDNWKIADSTLKVSAKPGKTFQKSVILRNKGSFFPLPRLIYNLPISKENEFKLEQPVGILRTIVSGTDSVMPVIDGDIHDTEWENAGSADEFAGFDGEPSKADKTAAYFMHDDKHIYFAISCTDAKMDSIKAVVKDRDGHVYTDDAVSLFISCSEENSYKFYFNSLGTVWDAKVVPEVYSDKMSWNGECDIKTKKFKDRWSLEMKVSYSQLGVTSDIKEVKINVRRKHQRKRASALLFPAWNNDPAQTAILKL